VFGSALIHPTALESLKILIDNEEPDARFSHAATEIFRLEERLMSKEEFGIFCPPVTQLELAHTSLLSLCLQRHFPKIDKYFLHWMHQLPDNANGVMDIALYVSEKLLGPLAPVAIIEVGSSQRWQAAAYAVNVAERMRDGSRALLTVEWPRNLKSDMSLRCYAPASAPEVEVVRNNQKFLWATTIWKGRAKESNNLAKLLQSIVKAAPSAIVAQETIDFYRMGPNVCILGDNVLKFYDYRYKTVAKNQRRSPSLSLKYLLAKLHLEDNDLNVITYPAKQGYHYADCVRQFVDVTEQLLKLHNEGICHGDIRAHNIVFCGRNATSCLIDFDFAGSCGKKKYPKGYSRTINDAKRHDGASGDCTLKKEHDSFSLASVMQLHKCDNDKWEDIIEKVKIGCLEDAIKMMEELGDCDLVGPSQLTGRKRVGTRSPPRKKGSTNTQQASKENIENKNL